MGSSKAKFREKKTKRESNFGFWRKIPAKWGFICVFFWEQTLKWTLLFVIEKKQRWFLFSRRRRFTFNCQRHTRSQKNDVRQLTFAMLFWALVEVCASRFGTTEKFWEVAVLWKVTNFFLVSVPPPGVRVGQPGPFPWRQTTKWTILRPSGNRWCGRSTALRSIRGVQWEYPSWSGMSQDYQSCPNLNSWNC